MERSALARLASSCAVETVLLDIVIPYPADLSGFRINTGCVWNRVGAGCLLAKMAGKAGENKSGLDVNEFGVWAREVGASLFMNPRLRWIIVLIGIDQ